MLVTEEGQVTIPEDIRAAAGVGPGSEVEVSLEGSRIVITKAAPADDRHARFAAAAARVRESMSPEFRRMSADEIMVFLRGEREDLDPLPPDGER